MAGIKDFDKSFKRAVLNINFRNEKAVRAIALQLFGAIITDTPVDTGRLRGNWQTTIGAPAGGSFPDSQDKGGANAKAALAARASQLKLNQSIFLTNNLPYAQAIEDGHSKQRPNGMVKTNVIRFQAITDQIARAQK